MGAVKGMEMKNTTAQNIAEMFEDELQNNIFNSRCNDTGDTVTSKQ